MSKSRINSDLQFHYFIKIFSFRLFSGVKNLEVIPFSQFQISNIMSGLFLFGTGTGPWITEFICKAEVHLSECRFWVLYEKSIVFVKDCEKRMRKNRRWFKIQCVWRPRIWVERIWKRMFSSCGLTSKHKCRKGVTNIACVINPTGFQLDKSGFQAHQNYHMYFTIANPISSDSWTKNFTLSRPDETFGSWSEQSTLIVWSTNDSCTLLELRWK